MPSLFAGTRSSLRWRFLLVLLPLILGTTLGMGLIARQVLVNAYEREALTHARAHLHEQVLPISASLRGLALGLDHQVGHGSSTLPTSSSDDRTPSIVRDAAFFLEHWGEVEAIFEARRTGDHIELTRVDRRGAEFSRSSFDTAPAWVRRSVDTRSGSRSGAATTPARLLVEGDGDAQVVWLQRADHADEATVGAILRPDLFARSLAPVLDARDESVPPRVLLFDARARRIRWHTAEDMRLPLAPELLEWIVTERSSGPEFVELAAGTSEERSDQVLAVRHIDAELGLVAVQPIRATELAGGLVRLDRTLLLVECAAFVLIALVILGLTRRVVVPIERLTRTMGDVARGDLSQRLPVSGDDEIAQLSRSFNTMISDLHTTHVALKTQSTRLAAALHEVEDVEAMKDSFLALVSHEVRTPLTSIMGGVEFLREEFGENYDATQTEFMGIVYDSARRLAGFMNDAIMMASLQASRSRSSFENFSITALLHGKFDEIVVPAASRGLHVENRMDAQREFFVHGDWTLLQVALEKILHNAVRHNRPEGTVVVEVVERILEDVDGDLQQRMVARGIEPADAQMQWRAVRVFNTGPVIPEAKIEGLFARFELTHDISNHQRGSGLSLPIAHYVLGYHGGCIEVRAVGTEGMAFYLVLPGKLSIQARTAAVDLPDGIDDTVTAAHLVQAAADDVDRLEAGIEAAEREDRRRRYERGETVSGPVESVTVTIGARLEEVGVRRDGRARVPQPDASGD